jgi:hypothetical protein
MRTDGFLMGLGIPSSVVAPAALNMSLTKAGRTTALTVGTVTSINATVNVMYPKQCGARTGTTYKFTNQIVTTDMSDGGDSGSLGVTNDSCHQPVGLLFAGSSTQTIFNPAAEVLSKVGAALGKTVGFVGTTCASSFGATAGPAAVPSQADVEYVSEIVRQRADEFMADSQILGLGVGSAEDNPAEAVLTIFVDRTRGIRRDLPERVAAARVKVVYTEPFVAEACCAECQSGN